MEAPKATTAPRIGLDYRPAMRARSGIGRYVAGLAEALAGDVDLQLYGIYYKGNKAPAPPPGARLVAWRLPSRFMRFLYRTRLLSADRVLGGCDLFHHTDYLMAQVGEGTVEVMTIHDLAFMYDRGFHPERSRDRLTGVVRRAANTCGAIVVPSEATAVDCEERLGLPRDRIFVTPLGVDPTLYGLRNGAPATNGAPYFLCVGTLEPRKNHVRVIRAFEALASRHPDVRLHLAGAWGWCWDELAAAVAASRVRHRIHVEGRIDDAALRRLMRDATAILYPSLLEGFGLPVLEGLAAGVPVLTSNRPPMTTTLGDAGVAVDPEDVDAIRDGMERLLTDASLREQCSRRGPEQASRFTWDACAAATKRAYEAVLS